MPAEPTSTKGGDAEAQRAIAIDGLGELRAALHGDLAREARFWRARAQELTGQMEILQKRLLALTELLPTRYAQLLTCELAALDRVTDWPDPLADWQETTLLEPASVGSELAAVWKRLGPVPRR